MPASQSWQLPALPLECLPVVQSAHDVLVCGKLECFPGKHAMQLAVPPVEYVPESHPGQDVCCAFECVPALQASQFAALLDEYLPLAQSVHAV